MKMLSFVIPCYNSAKTILTVVNEVRQTMEGRKEFTFEIILVNDNSTDETFSVIKQAALKDGRLTAIDLAKNFGQHSALMAGYSQATGDYIVSLDDDGQTPANEVFRLIDKLENGFDVVFASYPQKKHSFFRNFGSRINDMMAHHLIGKPKGLYLSSYFVARRFVIEELKRYTNAYPYVSGLLLRSTNRLANVSVSPRFKIDLFPILKLCGRSRPVDQIQIQIIQFKVSHRFFKSNHRFPVTSVGIPNLACNKKTASFHTGNFNPFSNTGFVSIAGRRINMTVSCPDCFADCFYGCVPVWRLPCAKTHTGYLIPIIQLKCVCHFFHFNIFLFFFKFFGCFTHQFRYRKVLRSFLLR